MNALTLIISVSLAALAGAEEPTQTSSGPIRKSDAPAPPLQERPTAEPLTLIGRGTEMAIIENGELEQLKAAPPILILPKPSRPSNRADAPKNSAASQPDKPAAVHGSAEHSSIEEALDARRGRLGRREAEAPPPARNAAGTARALQRRRR